MGMPIPRKMTVMMKKSTMVLVSEGIGSQALSICCLNPSMKGCSEVSLFSWVRSLVLLSLWTDTCILFFIISDLNSEPHPFIYPKHNVQMLTSEFFPDSLDLRYNA